MGLVTDERYEKFTYKKQQINRLKKELSLLIKPEKLNPFLLENGENEVTNSINLYNLIKRNNITLSKIINYFNILKDYSKIVVEEVNTEIKYEGYIKKQAEQIENFKKQEEMKLDVNFDYSKILGLRLEATQKLNEIKPLNIGQASRISGISPADISVLIVYFRKNA